MRNAETILAVEGQVPHGEEYQNEHITLGVDIAGQVNHDSSHYERDTLLDTQPHLPSEVPETDQNVNEVSALNGTSIPLDDGHHGMRTSAPGVVLDSTQQISQSFYTTLIKKSKVDSVPEDVNDSAETQRSLEEGDRGHVDLMSSFVTGQPGQEDSEGSEIVDFSPTQSQHNLTQYPESERFKTPATTGRKRNYRGELVTSPLLGRNPLRDGASTPGNVVGLSQAFAGTQAASSPFSNGLTTGPRSDRPSPHVELQTRPASAIDSSPLREISAIKRAVTEPASRYVSVKQSQAEREQDIQLRSEGDQDDDEDNDTFNEESTYVERVRRRKEREERLNQKLHRTSEPISSPHHVGRENGSADGTENNKNKARVSSKISAGVSALAADRSELDSEVETEQEEELVERTQQLPRDDEDKENQDVDVPRTVTSRRLQNFVNGSLSEIEASPSARQFVHPSQVLAMNSSAFQDVPNSQPGEERRRNGERTSSGTSGKTDQPSQHASGTEEVGVSRLAQQPRLDASMSHPGSGSKTEPMNLEIDRAEPLTDQADSVSEAKTVPETASDLRHGRSETVSRSANEGREITTTNQFDTARTHATPGEDLSSQPVSKTPPGKRRRRLMDISAEPSPLKSTPSFNFQEALELDKDAEIRQVLSTSPQNGRIQELNEVVTQALSPTYANGKDGRQVIPSPSPITTRPTLPQKDRTDVEARHTSNATHGVASIWDLGESPKKPTPRANERRRMPRATKHPSRIEEGLKSRDIPASTAPVPTAPGERALSTAVDQLAEKTMHEEEIVAPNRVFACFNGKIRAYYPAICLGPAGGDTRKYRVQWEGYEPDEVDAHGVAGLDLHRGDTIKINLRGFPKVPYTVHGFKDKVATGNSEITDVRGHRTLLVTPKQRKSLPSSTGPETLVEVPVNAIYLDNNMWGQMKQRPFDFKVADRVDVSEDLATPVDRAGTPSTPSTRRRPQILPVSSSVQVNTGGLFTNMAFAVSYDDAARKNSLVTLIQQQNGLILANSFDELFEMDKIELQDQFADLGFTVLLTEAYSRKEKYMQALALGLPCLSGTWVEACVKRNRLVDWQTYLLPAGECTELDGVARSRILTAYQARDGNLVDMVGQRPQLLRDASVIVVTGRGKAELRWAKYVFLIRAMGAKRIDKVADVHAAQSLLQQDSDYDWLFVDDKDLRTTRRLLSEPSMSSRKTKVRLARETRQFQCNVDGQELIVQSIILGQLSIGQGQ